jgi:hypothetical protein
MTLDRTRISALKDVMNQQLAFHKTEGYTILALLSTASLTFLKFTHSFVSIIVDSEQLLLIIIKPDITP